MQKPADQFQELGGKCISKIPNKDKIQDLKASGSEESRLCYVELEFLHRKSSRGDPELELLVRIFINNLQKVFKYHELDIRCVSKEQSQVFPPVTNPDKPFFIFIFFILVSGVSRQRAAANTFLPEIERVLGFNDPTRSAALHRSYPRR